MTIEQDAHIYCRSREGRLADERDALKAEVEKHANNDCIRELETAVEEAEERANERGRKIHDLKAALEEIAEAQQKTLAMIRREGFVFETPLQESTGWEKLAFTLYSTICEIDVEARQALAELEEK